MYFWLLPAWLLLAPIVLLLIDYSMMNRSSSAMARYP